MKRIACVGDSITWGFTIVNRRKYSHPALLQHRLGADYEVRNFGYNDAAARFDADTPYVKKSVYQESLAWNPDVVLLMLGSNDTKKRNWDLIAPIQVFQPMRIPVLGLYTETMENGVRPAIREIAADMGLELVDLVSLFTDSKYMLDGVHPQREGAKMLEEAIYSRIDWQRTV